MDDSLLFAFKGEDSGAGIARMAPLSFAFCVFDTPLLPAFRRSTFVVGIRM
jgi:hypothetical protein